MALSAQCSEACVRLVIEAVNENSMWKLLLAKHTYSETELLTSLTQRCNDKGETPVVLAMKRKNVFFIDQLVKVVKECDRQMHKGQLMLVIDQLSCEIPMVELIDILTSDSFPDDVEWLEFIAEIFLESTSSTRHDKIIALELIGALLIIEFPETNYKIFFFNIWGEAMNLRYFPADGELLLPKIPDMCVPSEASSGIFGSNVELMSMEELVLLQEDFQRSVSNRDLYPCVKRMKIQALLVIRRICYQTNHGHPHWLYLKGLDWCGVYLLNGIRNLDQGSSVDSKIVMNICLLILEQITGFDPKLLSYKSFGVFKDLTWTMLTCFNEILKKPLGSPEREELSYANLLAPTKFITTIECLKRGFDDRVYFANVVYHFLVVLEFISPQMTNQENQKLEEYYSNCIRNFFPAKTFTVLHAAALNENIAYSSFTKRINTVKLILKLGADPNAIDDFGRTPLHILAVIKKSHMNECVPIFQALMDAGGHLDMVDDGGETVLSNLKKTLMSYQNRSILVHPYFKSLLYTVFPLSCFCARVIRQHGLRFDEDRIPLHLQELVARHGLPVRKKSSIDVPLHLQDLQRDKKCDLAGK